MRKRERERKEAAGLTTMPTRTTSATTATTTTVMHTPVVTEKPIMLNILNP
jgi:hypothetical protein